MIAHAPACSTLRCTAPQRAAGLARTARPQARPVRATRAVTVCAAREDAYVQLATAKLPDGVQVAPFNDMMFQWANTLTTSGQNMPFALPFKVDPVESGFQISLLRVADGGEVMSVGDVVGTVEAQDGVGNVFIARFYEGPGSSIGRMNPLPEDADKRINIVLDSLVDVPLIMSTMADAIRRGVLACR